jgi:hypothetical protein
VDLYLPSPISLHLYLCYSLCFVGSRYYTIFVGMCQTVLTSTLREARTELFVAFVIDVTDGDVVLSGPLLQVLRLSRPIVADVILLRSGIVWDRTLTEVGGNRGLCTQGDWIDVQEDTLTFVPTCDIRSLKSCK